MRIVLVLLFLLIGGSTFIKFSLFTVCLISYSSLSMVIIPLVDEVSSCHVLVSNDDDDIDLFESIIVFNGFSDGYHLRC